jgi:hypothetical protein
MAVQETTYTNKNNRKFTDNVPVYSETKSPILENTTNLNNGNGEIVELQKRHYGTKDASEALDRSFSELTRTKDNLGAESFFNLYRELFYDLPKTGNNSHTLLINESKNYVKDYIDPKDDIIDELTQKIVDFERDSIEIPFEHPIFPNGTAIRVQSSNGSLGALGIMQEGRFRLVSNQGNPSPFRQLKRPLGFVDSDGKLLPDMDCFTFVSPQTFNDLPKFTDPLSLSAINENADYNLSVNNFIVPSSNFSEISSLINTAILKKEDINFLIRRLEAKIPSDGYTIEDNENTFQWDPVDLIPFNIKGNFQGQIKILDNQNQNINREDPLGFLIESAINDWIEEIENLETFSGNVTEANIDEYRSMREGEENIFPADGRAADIRSADNVLGSKFSDLIEDIESSRFIPYIWTNDPNRPNNVKFYWVERTGLDNYIQVLINRVNSINNSLRSGKYDLVVALATI